MMLYDVFCQAATNDPQATPAHRSIADMIQASPRYVLDRPSLMMSANFANHRPSSILKALPILRLPYPTVWIEWVVADLDNYLDAAVAKGLIDRNPTQNRRFKKKRSGALLHIDKFFDRQIIRWYPISSEDDESVLPNIESPIFDIDPAEIEISDNDTARAADAFERTLEPLRRGWKRATEIDALTKLGARMTIDGRKQIDYISAIGLRMTIALVILMNSRNLVRVDDETDLTKLNKKRGKLGQPKLLGHRPITINLSNIQRRRLTIFCEPSKVHRPIETHWVMRHFKVRKGGIFWWSPHSRNGDTARPRDYRVTSDETA